MVGFLSGLAQTAASSGASFIARWIFSTSAKYLS